MCLNLPIKIVIRSIGLFLNFQILFCTYSQAQINLAATPESKKAAVAEIVRQYGLLNNAIHSHDSVALKNILTGDFSMNGLQPQKDWLKEIIYHSTTDSISLLDPEFEIYAGAVEMEGVLYWEHATNGSPMAVVQYLISDIWVVRDGKLKLMLRLMNPIEN